MSQEKYTKANSCDPEIQRDEVPTLQTGLDLNGDLSRFQIITKVPYPNKSDYWQTSLKLAQAYGRSIRSKEDWANICILDSAFNYFLKRNAGILSDWFLQAIRDRSRDS